MAFESVDKKEVSKYLVTLDIETVTRAREAGNGNLSLGIRLLASGFAARQSVKAAYKRPVLTEEQIKMKALGVTKRGDNYYDSEGVRKNIAWCIRNGLVGN